VPVSGAERSKRKGPYPYHGAAGIMDYIDDYLFDGIYVLVGEDGSVIQENGFAITQYVWGKFSGQQSCSCASRQRSGKH